MRARAERASTTTDTNGLSTSPVVASAYRYWTALINQESPSHRLLKLGFRAALGLARISLSCFSSESRTFEGRYIELWQYAWPFWSAWDSLAPIYHREA